ncbi:hypothetical protein AHiyo8_07270 [Arthrobacter sp. Hiyo8]|nr:hypothetical protein AHiyo8_07270 [Arthrobacter sp. Hiyo8]
MGHGATPPDQPRTANDRDRPLPRRVLGPYFAGVAVHDGALSFSPEIWGGTLAWTGLEMLALAALTLKIEATAGTIPASPTH